MPAAPFNRGLRSFLTGSPDGLEPDVDRIFGKDFSDVLADLQAHAPEDLVPDDDEADGLPSLCAAGYVLLHVPAGVVLRSPEGEAVGGYLSCDISIDSAHQGLGLGRELVIERALRDGSLPTWWLDTPAYSPIGLSCHESAWRHARANPSEMRTRVARWSGRPAKAA